MKRFIHIIILISCSVNILAQQNENIPSPGDTFTYKKLDILETENGKSPNTAPSTKEETQSIQERASSSETGVIEGNLSISLTGAAVYNIPIKTPAGIKGIAPEISLQYNSQSKTGIMGYGWSIGGLSSISRIPSTKYHDNNVDGVDYDTSDRFALDGQRLILKSGTRHINGAIYETENYSNLKIVFNTSWQLGQSFTVYYPDGSIAKYGFGAKNRTTFPISSWEDHKGVQINYSYILENNSLYIDKIEYGGTSSNNTLATNKIVFLYDRIARAQQAYVGNYSFVKGKVLKGLSTFSNNVRYRSYGFSYSYVSEYPKIDHIAEASGDGSGETKKVYFNYTNPQPEYISYEGLTTTGLNNVDKRNAKTISLDISGNGKLDYLVIPNANNKFWLFKDLQNGSYNHPFEVNTGSFKALFPMTALNHQGKILAGQNIGIVQDGSNNTVNFKVYSNGTVTPIYYQYTKTWNAPTYIDYGEDDCRGGSNTNGVTNISRDVVSGQTSNVYSAIINATNTIHNNANATYSAGQTTLKPGFHAKTGANFKILASSSYTKKVPMTYVNGDFNGDGLTDILAIAEQYYIENCYEVRDSDDGRPDCGCESEPVNAGNSEVYFIDLKRNSSSTPFQIGRLSQRIKKGEGKILPGDFNGDGKTDIMHITKEKKSYIYTFNNSGQLELLWSTNLFSSYNSDSDWPFLLGDFNGDGKTDFMHPTAKDSKNFVLGFSTGTRFNIGNKSMPFPFQKSTWDGTELNTFDYIPLDVNNDGKTDIIRHHAKTYNNSSNGTQSIKIYHSEGLYTFNNPFSLLFYYRNGGTFSGNLKHYPIPMFLSSDKENKGLEFATLSNNWIKKFSFNYDMNNFLMNWIQYDSGLAYEIDYKSLDPSNYNEEGMQIYKPGYDQLYPYIDLRLSSNVRVASMFKRINSGSPTLKQLFAYQGGVYNLEGLGFLGFQGVTKSNWHTGRSDRVFTTSKFNIDLRGTMEARYSQAYNFNFNIPSSNYISKTIYQTDYSLSSSKVFKSWVNSKLVENSLQGVKLTTTYQYDAYNNPTNIVTDYFGDGSTDVSYTYANNTGASYYVGRATKRIETSTIDGNSFNKEQQFVYSGYQLNQIKSKGNGTAFNTVSFEYDSFGNVKKQTTTPNGEPSRIIEYEYDSTGRYIKKHTDLENLVTNYLYNHDNGTLTSVTNAFGQTTTYIYDPWYRQTKAIDYLGKEVTTSYVRSSNKYTISSNGDDGSAMISMFDNLDRLSEVHQKDILGQWTKVKYEYDKFDRQSRVSEPYSGESPTQWNETFYDLYGRPIERTLYTGKAFNITYNGLTTTVDDGIRTVSSTTDAMGNTKMATDPGGTINYTYHGNGNLKTADYGGVIVSMEINGWGQKTKLIDPSAGTYEYEYNGYGELTKEINPKGTTEYNYSSIGKLQQKIIQGDNTDMTISYTYHPTHKSLTNISMTSADGNNSNYTYTYDDQKLWLTGVIETNPFAEFEENYTYDAFGRVETEDYHAKLLSNGKTSQKKIANIYQNGGLKQIKSHNDNKVLWEVNSLNARGQITDASFGQVKSLNTYDNYGYLTSIKANKVADNSNLITLNYDFDSQRGLLNSRTNSMFSWSETFGYDDLDRLVTFNDNEGNKNHEYDATGRITQNSAVGGYNYTGNSYQLDNVDLNTQGDLYYQNNNLQKVSYNAFKSPHEIKQKDKDHISFQYNAFMGRSHRFYGGFEEDILQRNNRKHYAFDGSMEISYDSEKDLTTFITFIGGDAYSAPVIWRSESTATEGNADYYYLYRDYMNSIMLITDSNGNAKEKRHFDAWGNIVRLTDGGGNVIEDFKIIDRGYTGHEHLSSVGLIHMNGRLYDPNLKRFLSPDNYIQDITNTQNFNRYGYVLNNPLKYLDPSGETAEFGNGPEVEGGGASMGSWLAAVLASSIASSWDTIKSWDWKGFGNAISRPFREIGRFFKRLFGGGGGKKANSVSEVSNPQTQTMDPLARSSLGSLPSTSFGIGEVADIGLRIVKGYIDFERGKNAGFIGGAKSTVKFVQSLSTAQGWKNLGTGFVNMAAMATPAGMYNPEVMMMKAQMAQSVTNFVTNIPNMSAYEVGYAYGYGAEKVVESVLLSKGAGLVGNVVKGALQVESKVILVTPKGIALPPGAKIPGHFIENVHRSGSYGVMKNGKFFEKMRIDPGTPKGANGPRKSHFHLDQGKEHIFDISRWPWW